ncbi:TetR family transcriptional regulator [Eggerthellaceae bacterium zg-1084]|uniref:TetR/AcrR family transcriptional regulator C-terminal domain-containing protein n=1 Tax=Berryella wangjianweii TaxID=2734634 RepID=UPI0015568CAE|nr:TetR/AcrR family transcriptional regulator C-terminal domain-containing protein [Berryella wangjianweii]NPD31543.1 TetR family transcriptional regulator [Berryella wangjianweii]NPD32962.1 TetR family transcriptional regulator [Eggerthellaceae bacterium zg-997]
MSAQETMVELAEAMITIVEEKDPEKVSVSDIITAAKKNRKTFYYHFMDKNHLIAWIFRNDLALQLRNNFDEDQLVYETRTNDPCSALPYYVFVKRGVRSLDGSEFFKSLATAFETHRNFYARVLRNRASNCLFDYLFDLYLPAMKKDISFTLGNRHLSEEGMDFLAEFYTGAFLAFFSRRLKSRNTERPLLEGMGAFSNLIHESLENQIKEQQLKRML